MTPEGLFYIQCECGYQDFDAEAKFCSRCGVKRPDRVDREEAFQALVKERMQKIEEGLL